MSDASTAPWAPVDAPARAGDRPSASRDGSVAKWRTRLVELAATNGVVALGLAAFVQPWREGWAPIAYGDSDVLAHAAIVQSVGITGTVGANPVLGAPHGLSWEDFALGGDRVHLVVLRLLRAVTDDPVAAVNLYLLLGFFVVASVSLLALRALGARPLTAGAVSVLFTFAPYHFSRIESGHVFLAAYFAVPLGVLLAVWSARGQVPGPSQWREPGAGGRAARRRGAAVALLVIALGSSSPYYAVFFVLLTALLGVVVALRSRRWKPLVAPATVSVAIVTVLGLNLVGNVVATGSAGTNFEVAQRVAAESDAYGLRVAQMLLPVPGHRVAALGDWASSAYRISVPGETGAPVGLAAVVGLGALAVMAIRRVGRARPATDPALASITPLLAVLAGSAVALAAVSGLGMVIATLGFTDIRTWSRMSVVVGFLGLVGLGAAAEVVVARRPSLDRRVLAVAVGVVVVLGVLDQISPEALPDRGSVAAARADDETVAESIERRAGAGAAVLQLPLRSFPEGGGDEEQGPAQTPAGSRLRWSFGGMRGRDADWARQWQDAAPAELAEAMAAAGFDVVLVDRREYPDDGAAVEAGLAARVGPPMGESTEGTRVWFDVRPLRGVLVDELGAARVADWGRWATRPLGIGIDGRIGGVATGSPNLVGSPAAIVVRRADDDPAPVTVRFRLRGPEGAEATVRTPGTTETVELSAAGTPVEVLVPMDEREVRVGLETDATLRYPQPWWAEPGMEVADLVVSDPRLEEVR